MEIFVPLTWVDGYLTPYNASAMTILGTSDMEDVLPTQYTSFKKPVLCPSSHIFLCLQVPNNCQNSVTRMGYIWIHSCFNLGYKSNHTPDFIVHYYANCKIKVLYSIITLLFSLILRIVFSSYAKILLKSVLSCMGIFFCFLISPPLPPNLILSNCYARILMRCYFSER